MEEIRCALEEALEEPDLKLKIIERPVEEEDGDEEGENGGDDEDEKNDGGEEEKNGGGGDNVEEDREDDAEGWDENGDPCLPFIGSWNTPVHCSCTKEEAEKITFSVDTRNSKLLGEWCEMVNNKRTPLPAIPLPVLPEITTICVSKHECYHLSMMQVFSLRLSSPLAHPVNIYGTFSVRDSWEPLRNYLFKCSRDDPAMIPQSSPCRGIYVLQCFLIDIDLWIKEEGDGSADKQLFWDCHGLDMHFAFLPDGIETVIEVLAEAEHPSDVKFSASTSGFDDKISLYDGNFCKGGPIFKHFMAAGVGVVVAPQDPVPGFSQYFVMNVSFRTRGKAASAWQWSCICNNVRMDLCL
uniref:DUF6598 domain-containing protein n=1 Tax=Setaria viridis TaxID=4556 RepID=A0A4U6UJR8_SETVI|nr:hypothetical protein SEVIR_5G228300v2 [Setaria viridis]